MLSGSFTIQRYSLGFNGVDVDLLDFEPIEVEITPVNDPAFVGFTLTPANLASTELHKNNARHSR